MVLDKVIIDYTGWIAVDKNDLKIMGMNGENENKIIDTTNLTGAEIVEMLKKGDAVIESFGETYLKAIEGEDDWTYDNEIDEE